jgi:two-component system alkaline phosphatase synthesis response regulator PhoP
VPQCISCERPPLLGRVLIIEDDAAIRRGLVDALSASGYRVLEAADGTTGLEVASTADLDLVLLDVLMPGLDGMQVLERLRPIKPGLPVIMLTARGEEEDRVRGLRLGADDYVVKPFSLPELLARIEAVLRRSAERPKSVRTLTVAGRTIDMERREVTLASGAVRELAQREAEVLAYLAANPGRAVSREELLKRVWGFDPRGTQTRSVDMTVARLREHLDDSAGSEAQVIRTVRGQGYMLARDASSGTNGNAS